MKLHQIKLLESTNNPIIIVDVQPAYHSHCRYIVDDLMEYVNKHKDKILAFYNGEDMGLDNIHSVKEYFVEHGLDEDILHNINFHEKDYGWFRGWMDTDVDDDTIIKVAKFMIKHKIHDSRDIQEYQYMEILKDEDLVRDLMDKADNISLPPYIDINKFKHYNNAIVVGGGKLECLKEITLLMDALGMRYKLLNEYIYS